ncbi:MAG: FAD-dependent oxidoreductase [Candidatus Paceibacterota bacterium]
MEKKNIYDVAIIGSGVAGLAAGLYCGRYLLDTVVFEKEPGGETATAGKIANYPGVKSLDGYELTKIMKEQAKEVGAEFKSTEVKSLKKENHCFTLMAGDERYHATVVIFAGGAESRKLNIPNEKELTGKGVHYCVTCDGPLYTGKKIAIAGGGDSAVKAATLASEYAEKVYIINREATLSGEPVNRENLERVGEKVEVLQETEVKEIVGDEKFEKVILTKAFNGSKELVVDALFVQIGYVPHVELVKPLGVKLGKHGYIEVDATMHTGVDGLLVAGDTMNHFGSFKQAITAAASGALAATSAYEEIKKHGDLCPLHQQPSKHKLIQK